MAGIKRSLAGIGAVVLALTLGACLPGGRSPDSGAGASNAPSPGAPGSTSPATPASSEATGPPPNIVVFMLDDMRWDELNWMPQVRHFVARRGVVFDNSFSPDPLCCPARASFLTGQLTHNHGVYTHQRPFGFRAFDDRSTLATALGSVGYRTALVGKYLNGYGSMWTHQGAHDSATYIPPGWDDWYAGVELLDRPWNDPLRGDMYDYFDTTMNENGTLIPHQGEYNTDVFERLARKSLADSAAQTDPFFLFVTPLAPHHGDPVEYDDPRPRRLQPTEYGPTDTPGDTLPLSNYTAARPDWIRGRLAAAVPGGLGVPQEPAAPEEMTNKPFYLRSWPPLDWRDAQDIRKLTQQRAEALVAADVAFGRLMRALQRTGKADNTLVVVTSDNGFFLGEHRQREGKVKPQDPSLRVPLLIAGPGVPRGERRADPATTVDLTATLLDYAGAPAPHPADGVSLRTTIEQGDQGWNRGVPYEGAIPRVAPWAGQRVLNSFGVRTGRWSYLRYGTGETELYDLQADPEQLTNLAGSSSPELVRVQHRLDRLLRQRLDCAGSACTKSLPRWLQVDPATEAAWARQAEATHWVRYARPYTLSRHDEAALLAGQPVDFSGQH